jgi:hypothetical protein
MVQKAIYKQKVTGGQLGLSRVQKLVTYLSFKRAF